MGAYSEEADPEWTDSQPEPILPSPEYEVPHTQPDESEEEAWEGPPVPEIPEETPKAKSEIEGAEVDSEDEILTRERFLEVVVKDESLGMDRQGATKVYSYLRNKMKELGIVFGPLEMKQQLSLGSTTPTPKDPLAEPMSSKPDAAVLRDLEEKHSHFDSSQGSTVQRGSDWAESPDRTLEEKIEAVPEKDAYAVAVQHEMNQEKKERRRAKKEQKGTQACLPSSPLPEAPKEKPIQWGPITAKGRATFLAAIGQDLQPVNMDFAQLVEYSLSTDVNNLPDSIPQHVSMTIQYIRELNDKWLVYDFEDIDWWLGHGWGPWYFCSYI